MSGILLAIEGTGLLIVLVGSWASIRALGKARGVEASVGLLTTANEGLRQANADLKLQLLANREESQAQLHKQELECARDIAELRGQISVLTGNLADQIVAAVLTAIPKGPT